MELSSFDARPPLNVNDADLHPNMTEDPVEASGTSDMCFTAARSWVSDMWRTMIDSRRTDPDTGKTFKSMTIAEKETWVDSQHEKIMDRFFGGKPPNGPLHSVSTTPVMFLAPEGIVF